MSQHAGAKNKIEGIFMSTTSDTLKSIQAQLNERISSPLSGSFIISWLLWNHRIIVVLFSDKNVEAKFNYIDNVLLGDGVLWTFGYVFFFPFLIALAYIYVYPYPALWVFEFHRKMKIKLSNAKKKIDNDRLITSEEHFELKLNMDSIDDEYEERLSIKDDQIKKMEFKIVRLIANRVRLNDKNEEVKEVEGVEKLKLSEKALYVLEQCAESETPMYKSKNKLGVMTLEVGQLEIFESEDIKSINLVIRELVNNKYLDVDSNGESYYITGKGMRYYDAYIAPTLRHTKKT